MAEYWHRFWWWASNGGEYFDEESLGQVLCVVMTAAVFIAFWAFANS